MEPFDVVNKETISYFLLILIGSQNMQWLQIRKFSSSASTYHKSPILFGKYLGCQKSYRISSVFKICVWISVFRRKKQFVNPLHGSKVTTILLIQENSGVLLNTL